MASNRSELIAIHTVDGGESTIIEGIFYLP